MSKQCHSRMEYNLCDMSCKSEAIDNTGYCAWHNPEAIKERKKKHNAEILKHEKEQRMENKALQMFELLKEGLTFENLPIDEWQAEVDYLIDYIELNNGA